MKEDVIDLVDEIGWEVLGEAECGRCFLLLGGTGGSLVCRLGLIEVFV